MILPTDLIGVNKESETIEAFIAQLGTTGNVEPEDDEYFCSLYDKGCELLFDNEGFLKSVFLFAEGEQGAREYPAELPEGLEFEFSREEVCAALGRPSESGGGYEHLGDRIPAWDRFSRRKYILHVTYAGDLRTARIITVERP